MFLPVGVRFGVEGLVCSDVANDSRALVGKACKGVCLTYVKDLLSVSFIEEHRVFSGICWSSVCWG